MMITMMMMSLDESFPVDPCTANSTNCVNPNPWRLFSKT